MADTPRRRVSDNGNGPPTVIGEGVAMQGEIHAPGAVMLCGEMRGDGEVGGTLTIARGAHWDGQVQARNAVVAGRLTGSLTVEGKLEVGAAAVIQGRIAARTLAIARGAVIEGDIQVTSDEPIIQFEEKREAAA